MPRKKRSGESESKPQPSLDFEEVVKSAEIFSREQVVAQADLKTNVGDYDPVRQTSEYMQRAVQFEEAWETTIQEARERLLQIDARQLYFDFLEDLKQQIENGSPKSNRLVDLLEKVAVQGLGMDRRQIQIETPLRGGTRWRVSWNAEAVQEHLADHIVGDNFLNKIKIDESSLLPQSFLIGASDVSQHRSAVPVPARFFKRSVPFVLNNAAGTLFKIESGKPKYDNLFNPKPDETLLRWMLIDPSYQDELDGEDYQRCLASAMDVGQYKFDLEFLLKADKRVSLVFRDGSIFPQDAYLDNFIVQSKRGEFTREAIRELLNCLSYAKDVGTIYCGVSKNVRLKVFSAVVDWYIAKHLDNNWEIGNYTLNDGQAMTLLLSSPSFVGSNLNQAVSTCLIKRSFTTRAALNKKVASIPELDRYFDNFERNHFGEAGDITPYRALCKLAHLYMFFIGHSKSPQQQLPRYEFFHDESYGRVNEVAVKILAALQHCGLQIDRDHSFMSDEPVTYLLPNVIQQAHLLSKDVGKSIDSATGQWIMSRYKRMLPKAL
jgi:hypothetical protein